MKRRTRTIHIVAIAGSCRGILHRLGCGSAKDLISMIQDIVGGRYRVTGNARLIEAGEDEMKAGRNDDVSRASNFQRALANDQTAAIISLRGGSWLTRILPRIDFGVLRQRRSKVALFGFSELTTVINIASAYPKAVCWYDMGPAFIPAGLSRYARLAKGMTKPGESRQWANAELMKHFAEFFTDTVNMIEGRGSSRRIVGQLVAGKMPSSAPAKISGGTLSVLVSLLGTPYARSVIGKGRWLALEDVNESPHRIDRFIAHLKLSGVLANCAGILLGDFHHGESDYIKQVLASLKMSLPANSPLPIIASQDFGHTWPMAPLLIGRKIEFRRTAGTRSAKGVELVIPWNRLATNRPT